jgi:hypothetical protein
VYEFRVADCALLVIALLYILIADWAIASEMHLAGRLAIVSE